MELLINVSVGFVVGVIEPITPNGQYSSIVNPSCPLTALVIKSSIPGVFSAASLFFNILSSYLPIPVSSTASLDIISRLSFFNIICLMAFAYSFLFCTLHSNNCLCAISLAFMASSTLSNIP